MPSWKKVVASGSDASFSSLSVDTYVSASSFNGSFTGSLYGTASQAISSSYALTASYVNPLRQTVEITGSLNVSGSTTQVGNNTLLGNTLLSGSIIVSGSLGQPNPTVSIFGDLNQTGYTRYLPVVNNLDTNISASYIFVSGSTDDLYFSQNSKGYSNVTRLRWLEGNLYTGLLHGGLITTSSSTVYNISSGSGIIVNLNASLSDDPYPTVQYLNWGNLSQSIAPLSASYDQAFVGIQSNGTIFQQGTPFSDGQFDVLINIGIVLFQNNSTINGVKTQPSVAYGFEQAQNVFNRAFGPLKLSGYTVAVSGSSTGSIIVGSGTAYSPGSNYAVDPNSSYYTTDSGTNTSKFFRYYQSGSGANPFVYLTNAGNGYPNLDPVNYNNNGTLTAVGGSNYSIQRLFWYPNSVSKAIVAYYGNVRYGTMSEGIANLNIEPFTEAPNTAANAIYLGAYVIKGGTTTLQNPAHYTWIPGGLFRSVGGSGGGGSIVTQTLAGLSDVNISGPTNGQPLVYNSTAAKWQNQSTLTATLTGNADTATSASHATSASFSETASYVQSAQTASYVLNAVSSSYSLSASFAEKTVSTFVVTNNGASNYIIDGVAKPVLTFVPGVTYKFDTSGVIGTHPFRFSLTPNGPTEYTYGVTVGTNYTEIEVDYATSSSLFYYCTLHSGMGNQANTLRSEELIKASQTSSMSVLSSSYAYTASSATNSAQAISASYAYTASSATNSEQAISASYAFTASSAISAYTASSAINAKTALTASSADTFLVRNDITASSALITGTLTAQTLVVQTVTSSVVYSSGSNIFGNSTADTQTMTGSLNVSGSATIIGRVTANDLTGSLFGTASWANASISASYAYTASSAIVASASLIAVSASYAFTASSAISSSYAYTASSAINASASLIAVSSSYALTASYALNAGASSGFPFSGSAQITGSLGVTGSFSVNGNTGQTVFSSDADTLVISGSLIITGSASITGSLKVSGSITGSLFGTASWAQNAVSASQSVSSSYALTASYALFAANGGGGGVSAIYILDEGVVQGTASYFDFTGAGVTATVNAGTASINIPGGGGGSNTNSQNAILNQTSPALTWSFSHNLSTLYPVFTIYDNEDNVIIPQKIHAETTSSAFIYFSSARTGTAVASKGGDITSASFAATASLAYFAISASQAATASSANTFVVRNNLTASNALITGTLTAQTLVVQTVTSSIVYSSGSNIFGNSTDNTQTMTGSLNVSGSMTIVGKATVTDLTGSLFGTSSWAQTASTASYILNAVSSSYAFTASSATSSSLAQTASYVVTAQTASYVANAVSSSYAYTASSAISSSYAYTASSAINASASLTSISASYALTASYALNGGGGGLSALFIADEGTTQGTASYINFTGAGVTATVSAGTASINITGGGSTGTSGLSTTFTQSVAATEWTFIHNLNTRYPLIQVYDTTYNQVTPQYVSSSTADTVIIGFGIATAGYAVASNGGTLYVTGSNVILDQAVAAATWSFNHNLNTQYPIFQVFDSTNEVIIPERIVATDATSSLFYFPSPVAGKAVASVGGISGSMGSGVGFPFSGSAVITGSFLVSQSFVDFSNTTGVTGSFSGSLFGTASYATFALSASFAPGFTTNMSQSVAATTWSFTHNLNTINPIVQVYDLTNSQIIPNQIVGMNNSTAEIRFDYAQAGYAVASNGGGLYVTGSTSTLVQTVGAVTWSFTHNLNNKYNTYEVYDSNDTVIIPSGIKAIDTNSAELYFATSQTGRAVAQFSGINGAPNATTASYAVSASFTTNAATASYLNPIANSFVVLTQVSQSLNFVDDAAAQAGGVPLGGLYRNGNFILIRLS